MFRPRELMDRLQLSSGKVYQLLASGEIPHYRFGNRYRVSEEQLQQYLEQTKRERETPQSRKPKPSRPRLRQRQL